MKRVDRITVYRAEDGWRWNYRASNGRILADGGQGYSRRADCMRGMERVTGGVHSTADSALLFMVSGLPLTTRTRIPVVIEP